MVHLDFVCLHNGCPKKKIISVLNQTPTHEDVRESGSVVLAFLSQAVDKDESSVSHFGRFVCRTKHPA